MVNYNQVSDIDKLYSSIDMTKTHTTYASESYINTNMQNLLIKQRQTYNLLKNPIRTKKKNKYSTYCIIHNEHKHHRFTIDKSYS
jgi:hypothetical protein